MDAYAYPCKKTTFFYCRDCGKEFVVVYGWPADRVYKCPECKSRNTGHLGAYDEAELANHPEVTILDEEGLKAPPEYRDKLVVVEKSGERV